jgi:hypothetical protein
MKFFILITLCTIVAGFAFASNNVNHVLNKVDRRLNQYETVKSKIPTVERNISIPWAVLDKRESALWASIVDAYDHLKSFAVTERYNFMYEAMRATALGHPKRVGALKEWLKKENARMVEKKLHPRFYTQWKVLTSHITASINDIARPRPEVRSLVSSPAMIKDSYDFLRELRYDLDAIKTTKSVVASSQPEMIIPVASLKKSSQNYFILLVSSLSFLVIGLFVGRRNASNDLVVNNIQEQEVELPALPDEAFETKVEEIQSEINAIAETIEEEIIAMSDVQPQFPPISLEEECRKMIDDNSHLLEMAQVKVHPVARSPFKTNVNVPTEKVSEALNWLLKGTIAMVNTNGAKVSHMEWNCKEVSGRVSLEFVLHGLECDYKALYLNTLVEGDGSAPAHFGRTEMALEGHLPSVLFKSGNKRTTVSLGLDSIKTSMNH